MEDKATQTPAEETQTPAAAPAPAQPEATTATEQTGTEEVQVAQPAAAETPHQGADAEATQGDAEYPAMTMEDVLNSEAAQVGREVSRGDIVSGTVVFVGNEGIALDVGAKIEGTIPLSQISDEPITVEQAQEMFKPGDRIDAYVVRSDVQNGVIILSKKRAEQDRGWRKLQQVFETNGSIPVLIDEKVRGGLVANIEGVRAFLPASQVDVRRVNDLDPFVGQTIDVRLIELNRKRNRVIISRRAIIEEQKNQAKNETMSRLEPNAELEGTVVEITDFGVFVNLGGVDGLVHRSELTFGRFNHPRDVVKVGDTVHVKVIDVDNERDRINLSMKALSQDPWGEAVEKYSVGQRIVGKVTNLTNFGAFVEIEPGLEGLIHISEMSWTKRIRHPNEMLKEGDTVEAVILRIDPKDRRISLGLRQTQPDPWSSLPAKYPPGTPVKGEVTGLTDFGVFMRIEDGIEGLIHISELAHERVTNPAELFKKGDEIEAVVLNIDPIEQRASLSRKRLLPGGPPVREESASFGGANRFGGAREGGANRYGGGQRGGGNRRRETFDYDYGSRGGGNSANADAGGGKVTTKLGDVYADLFAQFGLGGKKDEAKTEQADAAPTPVAPSDAQAEASLAPSETVIAAEAPAEEFTPAEETAPLEETTPVVTDEDTERENA
jgi:small subunit ribosomal protein S1